jgi:hypothetical protein
VPGIEFTALEPTAYEGDCRLEVRWARLPLCRSSAQYGECFEDQEINQHDRVLLALQPVDQRMGPLVMCISGVQERER